MPDKIKNPFMPTLFIIDRIKRETSDTFTLKLLPQDIKSKITFAPGQFNMMYIYGIGEVPISITGDPADQTSILHTIRRVGNVTNSISRLKRGDTVGLRGPFGSSWPTEQAKGSDLVIVAGGIGLAPVMPVIYKILSERENYGRAVLLYGTRSAEDIIYKRELKQWRGRFDLELEITVDYDSQNWHGNVGVVTTLIPRAAFDPATTVAIICGPEIMMRYSVSELLKCGVNTDMIYLSMERNMKCALGFCGRCQYGPNFVCKDGPVFKYSKIENLLNIREL
ncbi:MAG: Ni/Fe hydrogenase subunit gamma [Candidatus Dadabacteria bacterium]|nr:Ni/Fe hydrogenase subunit gamma [Candidatus Dadabacteria bacterium]NIS08458.1 Ni/Fe hydrogenase subunit gamma [Candidatus Dadabacteria bacterium]NIY21946.1 Ni/Fe hydrogenase subunit gamma [Candidatus Dadabacteria bacterium]